MDLGTKNQLYAEARYECWRWNLRRWGVRSPSHQFVKPGGSTGLDSTSTSLREIDARNSTKIPKD